MGFLEGSLFDETFLTAAVWSNSRLKKRTSWGKTSSSKLLHINCNDFFTINFFFGQQKEITTSLMLWMIIWKTTFLCWKKKKNNIFRIFTHCIKSRIIVEIFRELAQLFLSLCWKHLLVVFGVGRTLLPPDWAGSSIGFKRFHNSFDTNLLSKCHPSLERNRSSGSSK